MRPLLFELSVGKHDSYPICPGVYKVPTVFLAVCARSTMLEQDFQHGAVTGVLFLFCHIQTDVMIQK